MAIRMVPDEDDRRTCATCTNSQTRGCQAVLSGIVIASRSYSPDRELLRRCEGYRPNRTDPDQRTGLQRWPGLKYINFVEKKAK